MKRRTYLATAGVATLAGCMGFGETDEEADDDPDNTSDTDTDDDHDTDSADDDENGTDDDDENGSEDDPVEAETFDDFESLSDWRVINGSASAYPDYSVTGSQSVLLEAEEAETQVRIVRELEEPIDCSELAPALAVAAHDALNIGIQLYDEDREKAVYRQHVHGMSIRHVDFGIEYLEGDPDLSNVTEIHIGIWTGDGIAEAWIDDLTFVSAPTPAVLLHFDGAYESHHADAMDMVAERDLPATAFVPTSRLREEPDHDGSRLTYDQVADLHDAGWTIASQTAHGGRLTSLEGDRTPESEIGDAHGWLDEQGYDGADFVAYPGGAYDDESLDVADEYHELGFAGGYTGHGAVVNATLLPRLTAPDYDDAEHAVEMVTRLGGIATLSFLNVEDELDHLEAILDLVADHQAAGDLEVITPQEVADEYVV